MPHLRLRSKLYRYQIATDTLIQGLVSSYVPLLVDGCVLGGLLVDEVLWVATAEAGCFPTCAR